MPLSIQLSKLALLKISDMATENCKCDSLGK